VAEANPLYKREFQTIRIPAIAREVTAVFAPSGCNLLEKKRLYQGAVCRLIACPNIGEKKKKKKLISDKGLNPEVKYNGKTRAEMGAKRGRRVEWKKKTNPVSLEKSPLKIAQGKI